MIVALFVQDRGCYFGLPDVAFRDLLIQLAQTVR
jgi:hypothetical protein